jgi:hypothetical protein
MLFIESIECYGKILDTQVKNYKITNEKVSELVSTGSVDFINDWYLSESKGIHVKHQLFACAFNVYDDESDSMSIIYGGDIIEKIKNHKVYGGILISNNIINITLVNEYYRLIIKNSEYNIENCIRCLIMKVPYKDYHFEDDTLIFDFITFKGYKELFKDVHIELIDSGHIRVYIKLKCSQQELASKLTKIRMLKGTV